MLAVDTDSFTQTAAWVSTPQGFGGGIWQAAAGPAADDAGNVYAMTANGGFIVDNAGHTLDFNGASDFAEAFVKLSYTRAGVGKGSLTLVDWLIPFRDSDRTTLGSSGPGVPPGTDLLLGAVRTVSFMC